MTLKLLKLPEDGMFSNVNRIVYYSFLAEIQKYKFLIDWSASCYQDADIDNTIDPWNYYFEDCFKIDNNDVDLSKLETISLKGHEENNIINPRETNIFGKRLAIPSNRILCNYYIKNYITLKPYLTDKIKEFKEKKFSGNVIGVHIRGPERLMFSVCNRQLFTPSVYEKIKNAINLKNDIPFDLYFNKIDEQIKINPSSKIFVCSDSQMVIDECLQKYGDKVITYNATRSEYGELHNVNESLKHIHEANKGLSFSRYKLGEDVIVEAYLLSETNYFIHGNSTMSNFIICQNPKLEHYYVDILEHMKSSLTYTE